MRQTRFANLELVPSQPELAGAAVELARPGGRRALPRRALGDARDRYDFVFLDCPPSLGPLTVNALAAADRVIVPVQAEYYALEGLSQLVRSVELVQARLNPRLALAGVLLTMVDARTRLAAEVEAEVRRHFGELVFTHDRAALGAPRRGAEPRPARDRLRPPLRRRRGLLEGGDGACRAFLATRRGLGRGLEVLIGGAEPAARSSPTSRSRRSTRTRASRAGASSRGEHGLASSIRRRASSSRWSCGRGTRAATS